VARLYAQLFSLVFLAVGVGGWFLGTASTVHSGDAQGNLGNVTLHMTWVRDVLDVVLLAVFVYVGFVADRRTGRLLVGAAGVVLVAIAIAGFAVGDDRAATKGFAGMHFPLAVNVFDAVLGVLGVLSALGTVEDEEAVPAGR
jgi:hypothetical protein